ncbi:hypothetical protein BJY52DRAFT_583653 [Lactarius psammicola]|nr:hypothetical protein BJY52DRAFT_583653 [Lactarius psammicola]
MACPPPPLLSAPPGDTIQRNDNVMVSEDLIPRQRKPKVPKMTSLLSILRSLQACQFTVIDLLVCIIDGQGEFEGFRNALFSPKNRNRLIRLFDKLYQDDKSHIIFSDWMFPHSITLVQEKIHEEMEAAKPYLRMHTCEVTPIFIEQFDIHQVMEPVVRDVTPTLTSIMESAGESKASRAKPKYPRSKNRATMEITYHHGAVTLPAFYVFSKSPH